jgi:hypothetical protein
MHSKRRNFACIKGSAPVFLPPNYPKPMSRTYLFLTLLALTFFGAACKKDNNNIAPTADAGSSQTVTLPLESVTLSGSGKDADGTIVTYLWEQVSGPNASVIVDPGAPSTAVEGLGAGTYIFQMSVWDNLGAIGTDTTVVKVNPAPSQTLTLQPDQNPYEYTIDVFNGANAAGPTIASLEANAWTSGGQPWTIRGIVKFDLSTIPSSAVVSSAHLYLYSNPTPTTGDQVHANSGADNSFTIAQVASDWSPSTITWSNQPPGVASTQIVIPSTTQPQLDLDVDVTAQVSSMVSHSANFGFLLKLQNEVTFTSRIFVASHNETYPTKHPKLVVTYQ